MKTISFVIIIGTFCSLNALAQNPLAQKVQTEFGIGISLPFLGNGQELTRSEDLREQGLSYFQSSQNIRRNVGSYSRLIGWSLTNAYYHPIKKVNGLMLGTVFRLSLTGSEPSNGGYEEGYFFNFTSIGLGAKYYPLALIVFRTDSLKNLILRLNKPLKSTKFRYQSISIYEPKSNKNEEFLKKNRT